MREVHSQTYPIPEPAFLPKKNKQSPDVRKCDTSDQESIVSAEGMMAEKQERGLGKLGGVRLWMW